MRCAFVCLRLSTVKSTRSPTISNADWPWKSTARLMSRSFTLTMTSPGTTPAFAGGTIFVDLDHHHAFDKRNVERLCQFCVQRLNANAQASALHLAVFDQLRHDRRDHVRRNRKPDSDVAAGGRQNRRVDADEFAAQIHERAARITRVDRSIRLNEILVAFDAEAAAAKRADDSRRYGLIEAERITDGNHVVADAQSGRIREFDLCQLRRIDLRARRDRPAHRYRPVLPATRDRPTTSR